jgi:hypothetical protein
MPDTAARSQAAQQTASSLEIIDLCEDSEEVPEEASSMPTITSEIRLPPDTLSTTNSQYRENDNGTTVTGTTVIRLGPSWSALFTPIPAPLRISAISSSGRSEMIDFLTPPLVTSFIVPRADRTLTEIKRLSFVRPGLIHSPLLCRTEARAVAEATAS